MSHHENAQQAATQWLVRPTDLPLIRRRCLDCPSTRFRADGKFRVNANHKLLDVWLLARCVGCQETIKLTIMERIRVRAIDPEMLNDLHHNDLERAAELLVDPSVLHRNRITLDWEGAWELDAGPVDRTGGDVIDISVRFPQRIPVRLVRLLSLGLSMSRAEVERLIAEGRISSKHRLSGLVSADFGFSLRP